MNSSFNKPEPSPKNRPENPVVWDLVVQDMKDRNQTGVKKYGVALKPFNGRDPLIDAYQESLDLVVYLRQALFEKYGA